MNWKKVGPVKWNSADGYSIEHSDLGLGMFNVYASSGPGKSGVGGSFSLAGAKQMAARHQKEQKLREALALARLDRTIAWKAREAAATRIRRCTKESSLEAARDAWSAADEAYQQANGRLDEIEAELKKLMGR
jgi:hypothetical protein